MYSVRTYIHINFILYINKIHTDTTLCDASTQSFRTIELEKDCVVYFKNLKFYPELETTAAAFSGGPVGPSDQYQDSR